MKDHTRRAMFDAAVTLVSATLTALTLAVPDWIERVAGLSLDAHNGGLEWSLAAASAVVTVVAFARSVRSIQDAYA